ncbi:MAG: FAD-dependent oxidoreductase [Clostridia bacterium]|nr:FAD-dependent oxidoreductase [Clostridia bacterium]
MINNVRTDRMNRAEHETDLCIVGGGLTGLCAAVAAAREGIRVVLMQDRPMLGGNASSEIRMWVRGAKGLHNRETGIISELEEENIYRNPTLCYSVWDSVMWEKAKNEKNIELILNCSCVEADTEENDGVSEIVSVTGWQLTTYTWHTVKAKYFADCSGDSVLATVSGAKWRVGREAHNEYDEAMGHAEADSKTMGMSCLIQARETDHAVPFIAPEWAYVFNSDDDFNFVCDRTGASLHSNMPVADGSLSIADQKISGATSMSRPHKLGTSETNFWWIEMGGDRDSLHDAEEMRDELLKIAYGIWDHVKNRGDHKAENWELSWVGFLPGKRESRRYIGKYVLTENDVEAGGKFYDTVAFGGWPMDDHNPAGFKSYEYSFPPSILYPAPSPYGIPYRVLYGTEVKNMFFAGRNISATHAALSSTRVMATCSLIGQAMGTAASLCVKRGETPDGVYEHCMTVLQSKLLDQGCYLPGFARKIPALSREAKLNISDEDREILFNGKERPDAEGTVNYITLPVGGELSFDFGEEKELSELRIYFDPDFSRKSVSVNKKMRVFAQTSSVGLDFRPMKVASTLCKSFDVFADGELVYSTDKSHNSLCRIPLDVKASKLTVRFNETWGCDEVRLFSADVR